MKPLVNLRGTTLAVILGALMWAALMVTIIILL